MAPKKRTRSAAPSSSPRYDSHRFQSKNRAVQFVEPFAKRNVGFGREIHDQLSHKPVVSLLTRRPWAYLMKIDVTDIMVDWVQEFYNNLDVILNSKVQRFVCGTALTITSADFGEFLDLSVPDEFDYPISTETLGTINFDEVATTLCGRETRWIEKIFLMAG